MGIGVACIPLALYALCTTNKSNRREEPLQFWLVMLIICIGTVFLWPVMSYLIVNHLVLERQRKRKQPKHSDWTAIEESWKKVTSLSTQLDDALNGFLDNDELHGEAEKRIRCLFTQIEEEYDRWSSSRKKLSTFGNSLPDDDKVQGYLVFLEEGLGWPRLKIAIRVESDPLTKERKISHTTVRFLFPQEPKKEPSDTSNDGKTIVRYSRKQITRVEGETHTWSVTLSGRFNAALKKLRGLEKEKDESAVTDIMLSPTTVHGNTKTPLSNNLRDFWRYRLGDWRIIYTVDRQAKTVTMLDYTHRSKAYH